ncbi:MAG: hypothetical protein Q9209_002401 [Squamulea sp. 1 TL-2023]
MSDQRLLDRVLIPETLVKMYYAFDTRRPDLLRTEVFADRINLDFTALFGGSTQNLSNDELVGFWMKLRDYTTKAQHNLTGILPLFPSSSSDRVPVWANVLVYLRREIEGQELKETRCDATLDMEVVKVEGSGENPWRVAALKANVVKEVGYVDFWADLERSGGRERDGEVGGRGRCIGNASCLSGR